MLFPRFTIRTALAIVTGCAVLFLIVGMAYRGQTWAWGVTIGVASLLLTALVHAAWFGVVWLFSQLPTGRQPAVVESYGQRVLPAGIAANGCEEARHVGKTAGEASH